MFEDPVNLEICNTIHKASKQIHANDEELAIHMSGTLTMICHEYGLPLSIVMEAAGAFCEVYHVGFTTACLLILRGKLNITLTETNNVQIHTNN